MPGAYSRTSGQPFLLPRAGIRFRNHTLGRTLVKSGIDGEAAAGQPLSRTPGKVVDDDVFDGLTPFYRAGTKDTVLWIPTTR
jgi:hypothetical protein